MLRAAHYSGDGCGLERFYLDSSGCALYAGLSGGRYGIITCNYRIFTLASIAAFALAVIVPVLSEEFQKRPSVYALMSALFILFVIIGIFLARRSVERRVLTVAGPIAVVALVVMIFSGCNLINPPPPTVTIVSDLPLKGSSRLPGNGIKFIKNAIKLALEERDYMAGDVTIKYDSQDNAAQAGQADLAKCARNAQEAAQNEEVVGWIGPYDSNCAAVQIRILNEAGSDKGGSAPLAMISPSATYLGFTDPEPRLDEWLKYIPTGERNFTRVIPADDKQVEAGAEWMDDLGIASAFIIYDQETYGERLADKFEESAQEEDIDVVGQESRDDDADDYSDLMSRIAQENPDAIYFAGTTEENGAQLLRDKVEIVGSNEEVIFMADALREEAFLEDAGEAAEDIYVTFPALPLNQLPDASQSFIKNYKKEFKSYPDPYAAYGYEATKVMLDAIERAYEEDGEVTRENVLREVFATENYRGVLDDETWSFEKYGNSNYSNGDTTLDEISGYSVENGAFVFDRSIEVEEG